MERPIPERPPRKQKKINDDYDQDHHTLATATTASTSIESPYLPFSIGPRNCIGQYIAMAEIRAVISQIILHYKLEVPFNAAVEPCPYLTLTVNPHEAQIQLSKR